LQDDSFDLAKLVEVGDMMVAANDGATALVKRPDRRATVK
jgi:hypothetical protein